MAYLGTTIAQARLRPRAERHRTLIKATVTGFRLPEQPALVRNVSQQGLGLSTRGDMPQAGDLLEVDFANGLWVSGKVAWVAGTGFGLALEKPISVEQVVRATQRQNEGLVRAMTWHVERAFAPRPAAPRLCLL